MSVSPWYSHIEILASSVVVDWGWSGHESRALTVGMSVLIGETPGSSLPPCEETRRSQLSATSSRGSSPQPHHAGSLTLGFQPPEWQAINFCCLQGTQFMVFRYSNLTGLTNSPILQMRKPKTRKVTQLSLSHAGIRGCQRIPNQQWGNRTMLTTITQYCLSANSSKNSC